MFPSKRMNQLVESKRNSSASCVRVNAGRISPKVWKQANNLTIVIASGVALWCCETNLTRVVTALIFESSAKKLAENCDRGQFFLALFVPPDGKFQLSQNARRRPAKVCHTPTYDSRCFLGERLVVRHAHRKEELIEDDLRKTRANMRNAPSANKE